MKHQITTTIESTAAVFGIAGSILVAVPGWTGPGFAAFLVSNLGWIVFSAVHRHWRLLAQQLAFLATSLLGLWNWWIAPFFAV